MRYALLYTNNSENCNLWRNRLDILEVTNRDDYSARHIFQVNVSVSVNYSITHGQWVLQVIKLMAQHNAGSIVN